MRDTEWAGTGEEEEEEWGRGLGMGEGRFCGGKSFCLNFKPLGERGVGASVMISIGLESITEGTL